VTIPSADVVGASIGGGGIVAADAPDSIAVGLKVPPKDLTWPSASNQAANILTASEKETVDAMFLTWQRTKIVM